MILFSAGATEDAINAARDALHAHLAASQKGQTQHVQDTSEDDLSLLDDKETDIDFAGESLDGPKCNLKILKPYSHF